VSLKQPRHHFECEKNGQMSLTRLRFFIATETILLIETKNENATDICAPSIIHSKTGGVKRLKGHPSEDSINFRMYETIVEDSYTLDS